MAKSKSPHGKDVVVGPNKRGEGWSIIRQGNERASRILETKKEAVDVGRRYAREEHSELVVKKADGTIQSKDSHGHDPKKSKG